MKAVQEVKKVYPDTYLAQSYGIDNMPNEYQVYRLKANGAFSRLCATGTQAWADALRRIKGKDGE